MCIFPCKLHADVFCTRSLSEQNNSYKSTELWPRKVFFVLDNRRSKMYYRVLESVFRLTVWLLKDPGTRVFELGLNGSGLGLMIFHKMSPRTHHRLLFLRKSLQPYHIWLECICSVGRILFYRHNSLKCTCKIHYC